MAAIRTILYFGKDDEFHTQLKDFTSKHLRRDFEVITKEYKQGQLIRIGLELYPNIVFIDTPAEAQGLGDELPSYKRIPELKHTLFVLLLKDADEAASYVHYLTLGVQLLFIKGNEIETLLKDSFYIGLDEICGPSRFAKAKELSINLTAGFTSTITAMDSKSMLIESDIHIGSPLRINLSFLENIQSPEFEVVSNNPSRYLFPMLETYEVMFPFPGPWDEIKPESLQPETIETFLDLKKDDFDKRKKSVFIYSENKEVVETQYDNPSLFLDFSLSVPDDEVPRLSLKKPLIIFIEESEKIKFEGIYQLIASAIQIESYEPLFIILNTQSSTDALRKLFKYEKLISSPSPLDAATFGQMLSKLGGKASEGGDEERWQFFKNEDKSRMISLETNVILTSLTEHEMTFVSEIEIPMFTVMQFSLPVPMFVTVVPPKLDLPRHRLGIQYEAIIHGLSEEELKKLRKIVNQMIYKPVKVLDAECVERMLKQKLETPEVKQVSEVENQTAVCPTPKPANAPSGGGRYKVNRKQITGKSKL